MGCTTSKVREFSSETPDRWQAQPTQNSICSHLLNIGVECTSSRLEFRALFEYSVAQKELTRYVKNLPSDVELCYHGFVEILTFTAKASRAMSDGGRHAVASVLFERFIVKNCHLNKGTVHDISIGLLSGSCDAAIFNRAQGELFELLHAELFQQFRSSSFYFKMYSSIHEKYNQVKTSDFLYESVLGRGSFGLVCSVTKLSTGMTYAMKIQSKQEICMCLGERARRCALEMLVLASLSHRYIASLAFAFQTDSLLILVLEKSTGCVMSRLLKSNGPFEPVTVRFIMAEIACAISYLHDRNLIFRDLKPANVLVNLDGHIRLIDFGGVADLDGKLKAKTAADPTTVIFADGLDCPSLRSITADYLQYPSSNSYPSASCTTNNSANVSFVGSGGRFGIQELGSPSVAKRAFSYVGTQTYMAPEVLALGSRVNANTHSKNMGYTKAVDWWSFGITMYRILLGKYPFPLNENKTTSLSAVVSGCVDFSALKEHPTTIDLISRLLVVSESNRLGYGDSGSLDVAKHQYFSCIDWLKLNAGELTPPPLPDYFFMKTVDVDNRANQYHNLTEVLAANNRYCWTQFGTPASTTFENDERMQNYFKAWNYASNEAIAAEIQMW